MDDHDRLPRSTRLNISAFAAILRKTTNSYKYLFLLALLQELANSRFDEPVVGFNQLRARMLAIAWVPIVQHRLSLGSQDQVGTVLRTISPGMHLVNPPSLSELRERVQQTDAVDLLRYVPELLIRPFFADTLPSGVVTSKVQSRIRNLAQETFATQRPLYLITEDRSAVIVHAEWLAYLRDNFGIVRGWALWQWLDYLQRRNPNVPNVAAKLGMNRQRQSLQTKRHYWDRVMAIGGHQEFKCIYTGASIDPTDYDLDHFVPWAFVSHDQLWNLTPVIPAANRSKSDSVPSEEYLPLLAQMHHKAFTIAARELPERHFRTIVEEYIVGLRLGLSDLRVWKTFTSAYTNNVKPLLSLASATGFPADWTWPPSDE